MALVFLIGLGQQQMCDSSDCDAVISFSTFFFTYPIWNRKEKISLKKIILLFVIFMV